MSGRFEKKFSEKYENIYRHMDHLDSLSKKRKELFNWYEYDSYQQMLEWQSLVVKSMEDVPNFNEDYLLIVEDIPKFFLNLLKEDKDDLGLSDADIDIIRELKNGNLELEDPTGLKNDYIDIIRKARNYDSYYEVLERYMLFSMYYPSIRVMQKGLVVDQLEKLSKCFAPYPEYKEFIKSLCKVVKGMEIRDRKSSKDIKGIDKSIKSLDVLEHYENPLIKMEQDLYKSIWG